MNSFFLQAGGLGWLWEPAKTVKIKNFSVVLYIYFNSFNSFICFRGCFVLLYQVVASGSVHLFNESVHLFNKSVHLFNESVHLFNVDLSTYLMYNAFRVHLFKKVNSSVALESNSKKGCWKATP